MTIDDLKSAIVSEGIISLTCHEFGAELEGGVRGFRLCLDLESPEEFLSTIQQRREYEKDILCDALFAGLITVEEYRRYRFATLQIEFVYRVLMVEWIRLGILPPQPVSTSAVSVYEKLTEHESMDLEYVIGHGTVF